MNYIKQLQNDLRDKENEVKALEEKLYQLRLYVLSDKFQSEGELQGYVNIKDILHRIQEN